MRLRNRIDQASQFRPQKNDRPLSRGARCDRVRREGVAFQKSDATRLFIQPRNSRLLRGKPTSRDLSYQPHRTSSISLGRRSFVENGSIGLGERYPATAPETQRLCQDEVNRCRTSCASFRRARGKGRTACTQVALRRVERRAGHVVVDRQRAEFLDAVSKKTFAQTFR